MAKVSRFEDLEVWKSARAFARIIYETTLKDGFSKDFSHKDQINRSSGSIMDNIAEGFERGGNKELIQYLFIAKGSAGEARSQLFRALDKEYINQEEFSRLENKLQEISKQLSGFINYLKNSEMRGEKYVKEPIEDYSTSSSNFES
jgi:four helix bundle protein